MTMISRLLLKTSPTFFQFENARSYNKVLTYILFALHTTTRRYTEMSSSSSSSSEEEDKDKKSQSVVVDASWRVEVPIASKEQHRDQKRVRHLLFRVLCRFAFVCLARFESPLLTTHTFFQSSSHADEREEAFSHGERGVDAAREDGWDWRESCDHDHSLDGRRMPRTAGLDGRSGEAGDRGDGEIRGKWVEERRGKRLR